MMLMTVLSASAKRYVVIDNSDGSPIVGATVIGNSGIIKGLTDNNGMIAVSSEELPITVRCIGFEPVVVSSLSDTIGMEAMTYMLGEVVASPADRPVKRVLCFAREYSSGIAGQDTMQYYCEYMAEAFIVDGKVKGYRGYDAKPHAKGYKRYARIVTEGRDSVFNPKYDDDITNLSWFDFMAFLPDKKLEVTDAIKNGAEADTIFGKYGPQFLLRKKNGLFIETADILSNHKNRRWSPFLFKLLGMTIDITDATWTLSFTDNAGNSFGINEFISGVYNIHLIGRGKWLKKIFNTKEPIEMDAMLELYPVDITNLTVDEYKEMRNEVNRIPFQYPDKIQPLSPAIQRLMARIDCERKNNQR